MLVDKIITVLVNQSVEIHCFKVGRYTRGISWNEHIGYDAATAIDNAT